MVGSQARNGDARLAWSARGAGEPVLLVMGLGSSALAWRRVVPHIAARSRAITFDNRGTGASSPVRGSLTMDDLAADAVAVLDAAGVESAHVYGVSMGGMIAQHLALDHRERVRSLILGCTMACGRHGAPPWRLLASTALRPLVGRERAWQIVAAELFAARTLRERPELVAEELELLVEDATPARTSWAQLAAISRHDTRSRLHELEGLEVTVLHGEEDVLIPARRGRELALSIPGAEFVMLGGCGHLMSTDDEVATAKAILRHIERAGAGAPLSA